MRIAIIGGLWKGRVITTPKDPSIHPTRAEVRAALFNILRTRVAGANILDLFAGSGALGLEAISRGAASVVFVDRALPCTEAIRRSLATFGVPAGVSAEVLTADVGATIKRFGRARRRFDLILADPPYDGPWGTKTLQAVGDHVILAPAGIIVVETARRVPLPQRIAGPGEFLSQTRVARYGDTTLVFYRMTEAQV